MWQNGVMLSPSLIDLLLKQKQRKTLPVIILVRRYLYYIEQYMPCSFHMVCCLEKPLSMLCQVWHIRRGYSVHFLWTWWRALRCSYSITPGVGNLYLPLPCGLPILSPGSPPTQSLFACLGAIWAAPARRALFSLSQQHWACWDCMISYTKSARKTMKDNTSHSINLPMMRGGGAAVVICIIGTKYCIIGFNSMIILALVVIVINCYS